MECLLRQQRQRFGIDFQDFFAIEVGHRDVIAAQQIVFGIIFGERKGILIIEGFVRHVGSLSFVWPASMTGDKLGSLLFDFLSPALRRG